MKCFLFVCYIFKIDDNEIYLNDSGVGSAERNKLII